MCASSTGLVDQCATAAVFILRQQPVHLPLTDPQNGCRRCHRPPTCQNIGQHFDPLQIALAHRQPARF
jgi:hypothetical protein